MAVEAGSGLPSHRGHMNTGILFRHIGGSLSMGRAINGVRHVEHRFAVSNQSRRPIPLRIADATLGRSRASADPTPASPERSG